MTGVDVMRGGLYGNLCRAPELAQLLAFRRC